MYFHLDSRLLLTGKFQILSRRHNATVILSTTPLIRAITPKLGRFLGPLGLMPSERRGTVTDDIPGYLSRLQGTSEWRGDKDGTIRAAIAKVRYPHISYRGF
jgi:large subunit ribosomal protein L1